MRAAIKEFLRSEDGFLPLIGGLLAGGAATAAGLGATGIATAGLIGNAVGETIQNRKDQATNNAITAENRAYQLEYNRKYFKRLRRAAVKGGFHPLEALRGGGGGGYGGAPAARAPISTTTSRSNSFDKVQDILTGDYARRRAAEDLNMEIGRVNLDIARRKLGNATFSAGRSNNSSAGTTGVDEDPLYPKNNPYLIDGKVGAWSDYPTIKVSVPWIEGGMDFPEPLARKFDLVHGMPLTADIIEDIAGDELGQVMFADWLATNGLEIRGMDTKTQQKVIAGYILGGMERARRVVDPDFALERGETVQSRRASERASGVVRGAVGTRNMRTSGYGSRSQAERAYH